MFWLYGRYMIPMKVLRVEASEAFLRDQQKKRRSHALGKMHPLYGKFYRTYLLCIVVSLGRLSHDLNPSRPLPTMNRLWKSDRSKS